MTAIISGARVAFTDDDLLRLSETNPGWKFERDDDGALLVSPTSSSGGAKSLEAAAQLRDYSKVAGGKAFDSSTGFKGPRGGVFSPDGSWISAERIERFKNKNGFWKVLPDVVIEVASESDSWPSLTRKIDIYIAGGAGYGLAIDPRTRETCERGRCPDGLVIDIDAIIDA